MYNLTLFKLTHVFQPLKEKISRQLADFRTALLWIVPCIILSSILILIAGISEFISDGSYSGNLILIRFSQQIHILFGYLLTAALTFTVSMRYKQPRPPFILLSVFYLGLFQYHISDHPQAIVLLYFIAIITPFYTIPCITHLQRIKYFKPPRSQHLSGTFSEIIDLLIPAFLTMLLTIGIHSALFAAWEHIAPASVVVNDLKENPYYFSFIGSIITALSHFFGLHSFYTLSFLNGALNQAVIENSNHFLAGVDDFIALNRSTIAVFSRLGGTGSTFSLIIAILLFSKEKSLRFIALISIPPGLFNINETLVFGIPIILNPVLLIPFLLAPLFNICLALLLTEAGILHPTVVSVPYISPLFINAYIATDGDWFAVLLQIFNIGIGTLIYLPFVRKLGKLYQNQPIYFSAFDSYYQRKREEAHFLVEDQVSKINRHVKENVQLEQALANLSSAEFFLEYQPQISLASGEIIGAEALIRVRNNHNEIYQPCAFLPWLDKAGMMADVDSWVFSQAIDDAKELKKQGIDIRLRINVSIDTLISHTHVTSLIRQLKKSGVATCFDIEISEKSLLKNEQMIASVFESFHSLGINIHLDDFGTGYSSLSYLPKFDIDEIKIDRSFLQGIHHTKGKNLFLSLFDIADNQGLSITVEGIETQEQLSLIPPQHANVTIQGWYYSQSLTLPDFIRYHTEFNPEPYRTKEP